ncbi:MAG TPA: NUDIX domain-containing protein [Acidimicrobiales bacterium]|nr:NUDIX domain-containing protein [Acidimicrobiales bacterium]
MSKQHSSTRAYGVLMDESRVILVRSSNPEHDPPLWWLPGGGIHFGESPEETLQREFIEETGLRVHRANLVTVSADTRRRSNGDRIHTVRIIYTVELLGGELTHEVGGTSDHAMWFEREALADVNLADYARQALDLIQGK